MVLREAEMMRYLLSEWVSALHTYNFFKMWCMCACKSMISYVGKSALYFFVQHSKMCFSPFWIFIFPFTPRFFFLSLFIAHVEVCNCTKISYEKNRCLKHVVLVRAFFCRKLYTRRGHVAKFKCVNLVIID